MSGSEELDYKDENQTRYATNLPVTDKLTPEQWKPLQQEIDVVIMTATKIELYAVAHLLKPYYPDKQNVFEVVDNSNRIIYYLGKFGNLRAVITQSEMGTTTAFSAADKALKLWKPNAIIMVGIAFGRDKSKQKIADVLVASEIIAYEKQRIGKEGATPLDLSHCPSSQTLTDYFKINQSDWNFKRHTDDLCPDIKFAQILSGNTLFDNQDVKNELFQKYSRAWGGEMEGAGLYLAARQNGDTRCILVKSICDWADGTKNDKYQPLAAAAAASLVHHVLSQKAVVDELSKRKSLEISLPGISISVKQQANPDDDKLLEILNSESDETQRKIINQYHKYLDSRYWIGGKANNLQQMLADLTKTENKKTLEEFLKLLINSSTLSSRVSSQLSQKYQLSQSSPNDEVQPYLLVKFTPTLDKKLTFTVKAWLIYDTVQTEPQLLYGENEKEKEKKHSLKELQDKNGILKEIINDSLQTLTVKNISKKLKLEFFLPVKYIYLPIHQWEIHDDYANVTIGIQYPVVVRSLERLLQRYFKRRIGWLNKWKKLNEIKNSEFKNLFVTLSQTDNLDKYLEDKFAIDNNIGLKLSCASFVNDSTLREKLINRLLSSGTPIAILPINDLPELEIDSLLRNEQQKGIRYLPNCLYDKRIENRDVGQNLVLLWEDPYRLTPDVEYKFESPTEYSTS